MIRTRVRRYSHAALLFLVLTAASASHGKELPIDPKNLGTIVNRDINSLGAVYPAHTIGWALTPQTFKNTVTLELMFTQPDVWAMNVGCPDPVIYRSKVATGWDKYLGRTEEIGGILNPGHAQQAQTLRDLKKLGTDPLEIAVEACHEQGILIVADYRMNAEDFYDKELELYDFGREHKEWRIPGANCLDPAIPQVYEHRMAIFREVAENYDIDGIEFDFRRWFHMVSDPHKNHTVLTRMVRDTRRMLDEVAAKKGRRKLLLGARVGINIDGPSINNHELSCRDLGLDVRTWVAEGLVDYLSPAMFNGTFDLSSHDGKEGEHFNVAEFAELIGDRPVGLYPSLRHYTGKALAGEPANGSGEFMATEEDRDSMRKYKNGVLDTTLHWYDSGADGISTFNWNLPDAQATRFGFGAQKINVYLYPRLSDAKALRAWREADWLLPEGFLLPWEIGRRWKE